MAGMDEIVCKEKRKQKHIEKRNEETKISKTWKTIAVAKMDNINNHNSMAL